MKRTMPFLFILAVMLTACGASEATVATAIAETSIAVTQTVEAIPTATTDPLLLKYLSDVLELTNEFNDQLDVMIEIMTRPSEEKFTTEWRFEALQEAKYLSAIANNIASLNYDDVLLSPLNNLFFDLDTETSEWLEHLETVLIAMEKNGDFSNDALEGMNEGLPKIIEIYNDIANFIGDNFYD